MLAFLSILKLPFVNRLNTFTNNKKLALATMFIVGGSSLGFCNQETVEMLSGLPAELIVPGIIGISLFIFIPKVWNFLFSYRLDKMKNENEVNSEELKNLQINKEILLAKKELDQLKSGVEHV